MFNWHQNKKWATITFDKISSWIEWSRKWAFYRYFSLPWQYVIIKLDFVCVYCNMLFSISCLTLGLIMHCWKTSKGYSLKYCWTHFQHYTTLLLNICFTRVYQTLLEILWTLLYALARKRIKKGITEWNEFLIIKIV